jgi:hypothetical protein
VGAAGGGKSRLVYEGVHAHHTLGWPVLERAAVSSGKATPDGPGLDRRNRSGPIEDQEDTRTIRAKGTGQGVTLDEAVQEAMPAWLGLLDARPDTSPC